MCVDEWTGGNCTTHYMTLGGGPMKMTVDAADDWCNTNSSCHGFTFKTNATGETEVYFRDETQIFFMDSQLGSLTGPLGQGQWTSHVKKERAAPLSPSTSGLQVWVKDMGGPGGAALALLLVNHGQTALESYSVPVSKLPPYFKHGGKGLQVRDIWNRKPLPPVAAGGAVKFAGVAPHDSVFLLLRPASAAPPAS